MVSQKLYFSSFLVEILWFLKFLTDQKLFLICQKVLFLTTVYDNKQLKLVEFCTPFVPPLYPPPLTFLVFGLWRWPRYQNCSKISKVFEFFGFKSKICFYKRLWLKTPIDLKKKCQKMQFFMIFIDFYRNMFTCSGDVSDFFFLFLVFLKPGEHF